VLTHLFPDLDLSFDSVKECIENNTGDRYELPDYKPSKPPVDKDLFL
jgi:hypothetical protein